jgi:hypothetical protein
MIADRAQRTIHFSPIDVALAEHHEIRLEASLKQ